MAHKVQDWQVLETALQQAEVAGVAAELLECLSSPLLTRNGVACRMRENKQRVLPRITILARTTQISV